jgi:hypothetical protein
MNAMLTWWAVSLALISHSALGNEILDRQALVTSVPVFVAVLVWLMRVLMIGTFTLAGDRLFQQDSSLHRKAAARRRTANPAPPRTVKSPGRKWSPPSYEPEPMVARTQTRH